MKTNKKNKQELIIKAIGGYSVIGRNMTVVQYGEESVILDMGLYLDRYIAAQDSGKKMETNLLIDTEAIPNDREFYAKHGKTVKAIVLGHAHLDHIGALKYLAAKYDAPIIASPYTIRLIEKMAEEDNWKINNKLIPLNLNSHYKLSDKLTLELISVTHSTLQSAITIVHTPSGAVVYTPDYKLDNTPTVGQKTNVKRLRELGKARVAALMVDCTQADTEGHTFSEKVARGMLKDLLATLNNKTNAIIVTTFSSHISRLQSILDWGELIGREVVFVGRSLGRYIGAAEDLKLINFSSRAKIIDRGRDYKTFLKKANSNRGKYLIAMTGNQGEPNAMLARVANDEMPFSILPGDAVIFSCTTIPTPIIRANRRVLEQKLHRKKARIFKDVHVSGHAGREDHRALIKMLRPNNVIPCHGDMTKMSALVELANEIGYSLGKNVHLLQEGQKLKI